MHYVPYILHRFKGDPRLEKVWPCVISLLQIIRIIYSANINESDLRQLEAAASSHLKRIIECFNVKELKFKHHMMIHYANIIRAVGPVVHMSTMRFEMKHKSFTNYARRSNNYRNVTKSLALNNQRAAVTNKAYQNVINHGKLRIIRNFLHDEPIFEANEEN